MYRQFRINALESSYDYWQNHTTGTTTIAIFWEKRYSVEKESHWRSTT
jgi:hypothetical protein